MVRLFIQNTEVELTDDVQFAITKQFEDTTNPTDIINDWSKTVSIPFSHNNDALFGHIYNPNRAVVGGSGAIGIYFNPLRKLDFRLEWDNIILMMGYAKLNEIKQVNGKGTYEITLFGQLGKVFQEMQKITFDTTTTNTAYLINGSQYVNETMSKNLVHSSWTSTGQTTDVLKVRTDSGYSVTDIIGFAPNNSFSNEFKYDSYQNSSTNPSVLKFADVLNNNGFQRDTGIDAGVVIPNGLLPREIGEYRSYYQLPYIYWNKLFKIFQAKAESITGYKFNLDSTWFNTSNPYWYNLVYMLKQNDIKKTETYNNTYSGINELATLGYWPWINGPTYPVPPLYSTDYSLAYAEPNLKMYGSKSEQKTILDSDNVTYYFNGNDRLNFNITLNPMLLATHSGQTIASDNSLIITIKATGSNGHVESRSRTIYASEVSVSGIEITIPTIDAYFLCEKSVFGNWVKFTSNCRWTNSTYPLTDLNINDSNKDIRLLGAGNKPNTIKITIKGSNWGRSGGVFTLNDLWNNDYNLFEQILNYCKMYRIGVFVDNVDKIIYFKPYTQYFSGYTVMDWTDKVDKSRDFTIKPITFENKYVLFNYKDLNTKLGKEYKDRYGVNYGDYRLITDYNFNTETTTLFKNITASMVATDNVLTWTNLLQYHTIAYSFPSEIMVNNTDKDKKQVDLFGAFYFHNGLATFSTEASLHMGNVIISDDTPYMESNSTYMYNQASNTQAINVSTYPKLDIVRGDNMCVFNIPKENYTYLNNYSGKKSIYTNFWESYVNEKYNIQNKQITCYMNIKPTDYVNFDFNKLIRVENQLCLLNKIYDYDVTNNGTTKVELITIYNLDGYTTNG